ncbi:uncharacterized protein LOC117651840 isoform X2 [Thrips palmi]|uniref:Uncharacterized protein LOC117651840 isoform X2 n=1 Tax=Thrips palmi TaxID=161013 RepID=A0A6P9A2T7_THRPL|nr:uncharacterized protein LOC117651840 isoform X2 [Thrips palmi]
MISLADEDISKLWQRAIGCLVPPTNSMKVCSKHFKAIDYQTVLPGCKRLKRYAVPSLFLPTKVDAFSQTNSNVDTVRVSSRNHSSPNEVGSESHRQLTYASKPLQSATEILPASEESTWVKVEVKEELNLSPSMHFSHKEWSNMLNDSEFYYLSGISKNCFQSLFVILTGEPLTLPSCNMAAQEQLLLTLCKYKHNFPYPFLSIFFKMEQSDALAVFSFWTYHMFKTLKLYFGMALKADSKDNQSQSVTVGVVKVPVLQSHWDRHTGCGKSYSLKSLVVVDDESQSVVLCSKLYGKLTSNDLILHEMEFQQCFTPSTSITLQGPLKGSAFVLDGKYRVSLSENAQQCLCSEGGESTMCLLSSFLLNKCFQCLMEVHKILSDGIPPNLLTMSSEIFFNCMMLFNFAK